jgi:hypothetical protein
MMLTPTFLSRAAINAAAEYPGAIDVAVPLGADSTNPAAVRRNRPGAR